MNSRECIAVGIAVVLSISTCDDAQGQRIPVIEEHVVAAVNVDEAYVIQLGFPDGYDSDTRHYPVVYVLDAEKSFGLARDIIDWLSWAREIPPMIVVGISYGEDSKAWWSKRSRDYTPSSDRSRVWGDWPLAGGADDFRVFLARELFPFIESNYRVNTDRTLIGISFGGLFGAYDLFQVERLFNRYLLVSPALAWDHEAVLQLESEYRRQHRELPVHLYTAVGGEDQPVILESWERWNQGIETGAYQGLRHVGERLAGETHISVFPTAVTHGLKAVWREAK